MNVWKGTTFVFASLFAVSLAVGSARSADADKQQHLKVALSHLRKAAHQLDKASADRAGHKARALELTRAAIQQVEQGLGGGASR
jgi:hypothetical protein